jgi:hypothetical protein
MALGTQFQVYPALQLAASEGTLDLNEIMKRKATIERARQLEREAAVKEANTAGPKTKYVMDENAKAEAEATTPDASSDFRRL